MDDLQQQVAILTRSAEILSDADLCGCSPTVEEMQEILAGLESILVHLRDRLAAQEAAAGNRRCPIGGGAPGSDGHGIYLHLAKRNCDMEPNQ